MLRYAPEKEERRSPVRIKEKKVPSHRSAKRLVVYVDLGTRGKEGSDRFVGKKTLPRGRTAVDERSRELLQGEEGRKGASPAARKDL